MVKLGFIGFGEAAFNIAEGLKSEGLETICAYDKFWNVQPNSELICGRAEKAHVELVQGIQELIEKSEWYGYFKCKQIYQTNCISQ